MSYAPRSPHTDVLDTPDESGERPIESTGANDAMALAQRPMPRQWNVASEILGQRVDEMRCSLADPLCRDPSAQSDWWVEDLEGVRQALEELRALAAAAPAQLTETRRSPLAAYLTAAFVWCGDIAHDVVDSIRVRRIGVERRRVERTTFVGDSEAYITCFLDPFFRTLNEACAKDPFSGPPIRAAAERLQSRIVAFHWTLCGTFTRAPEPDAGANDG